MRFIKDKRGVSAMSIMLLALLVLSVVLLNGTSIAIKSKEKTESQQGKNVAISYCAKANPVFPAECKITKVYQCDSNFLLRSGCIGAGDIILNQLGEFVKWCGYTSLEGVQADCGKYWIDAQDNDCTKSNNLCIKK